MVGIAWRQRRFRIRCDPAGRMVLSRTASHGCVRPVTAGRTPPWAIFVCSLRERGLSIYAPRGATWSAPLKTGDLDCNDGTAQFAMTTQFALDFGLVSSSGLRCCARSASTRFTKP